MKAIHCLAVPLVFTLFGACASTQAPLQANTFDVADPREDWGPYFDHDAPGVSNWGASEAARDRALDERPYAVQRTPVQDEYAPIYEPVVARQATFIGPPAPQPGDPMPAPPPGPVFSAQGPGPLATGSEDSGAAVETEGVTDEAALPGDGLDGAAAPVEPVPGAETSPSE